MAMVLEWRRARNRTNGGLNKVAQKLGVHAESVRNWVNQNRTDAGERPGTTSEEKERIKELERENKELQRANEILRRASAYFAQAELDRQWK